jgi:hypothetical protein
MSGTLSKAVWRMNGKQIIYNVSITIHGDSTREKINISVYRFDDFTPYNIYIVCLYMINFREYRRGNQKWTIQRNWHHMVHKTKKNTTQYVLDTKIGKQTQISHEPYDILLNYILKVSDHTYMCE